MMVLDPGDLPITRFALMNRAGSDDAISGLRSASGRARSTYRHSLYQDVEDILDLYASMEQAHDCIAVLLLRTNADRGMAMVLFLIPSGWAAVVTLCVAVCRTAACGDETPAHLPLGPSGPSPNAPSLREARHPPGAS